MEEYGLLINSVCENNKNEAKEQSVWFLGILLGTLGANLFGNMLAVTRVMRAREGSIRAGKGTLRTGQDF